MGDSDFVEQVLGLARERMERVDLLREKGMNFDAIAAKVAEALGREPAEIYNGGGKAEDGVGEEPAVSLGGIGTGDDS